MRVTDLYSINIYSIAILYYSVILPEYFPKSNIQIFCSKQSTEKKSYQNMIYLQHVSLAMLNLFADVVQQKTIL